MLTKATARLEQLGGARRPMVTSLLLLYDHEHDCIAVKNATGRHRLMARWHATRLDHELADGASPDATVLLALRAQALVRPEVRHELERTIERLLTDITEPSAETSGVEPGPGSEVGFRTRVRNASSELLVLLDRLRAPGPVPARGIAKVRVLLTDGTSPLHRGGASLEVAVRQAAQALEPLHGW